MSLRDALLEASEQFCEHDNCGEAIDSLRNAVRLDPSNPAVLYQLGACLSGKCRPHPYVDMDEAARWLRRALDCASESTPRPFLARILETLGAACTETWPVRMEEALHCYREASRLYAEEDLLEAWARVEFNLANAICELPHEDFPHKWRDAIVHYRNALRHRTREHAPERWAATQQNLGSAYRAAGRPAAAVGCLRRALRVYTAEAYPRQHAAIRINLANVYLSLDGGRGRKACRALDHLDRVLELREALPYEKALAHFHRAQIVRHRLPNADPNLAREEYRLAEEGFEACGRHDLAGMARQARGG